MRRNNGPRRARTGSGTVTMQRILTATLDMARNGELVIYGSIDGAGLARLSLVELDLVVTASPAFDTLSLSDGRVVAAVEIGFAEAMAVPARRRSALRFSRSTCLIGEG